MGLDQRVKYNIERHYYVIHVVKGKPLHWHTIRGRAAELALFHSYESSARDFRTSVADPEEVQGGHSNPPSPPPPPPVFKYPIKMNDGLSEKNEIKSVKRTLHHIFIYLNPLSRNPGSAPELIESTSSICVYVQTRSFAALIHKLLLRPKFIHPPSDDYGDICAYMR